jgi:dihydrofolate reductase
LRDGRVGKLFNDKNVSVYVALAWLTDNEDEIVCDFEGLPVERYEEIINGRRMYKYVKKKLRITKIINKEEEIFEVEGWIVDVNKDAVDPVNAVKVLEIYSRGKESGLKLESFLTKK